VGGPAKSEVAKKRVWDGSARKLGERGETEDEKKKNPNALWERKLAKKIRRGREGGGQQLQTRGAQKEQQARELPKMVGASGFPFNQEHRSKGVKRGGPGSAHLSKKQQLSRRKMGAKMGKPGGAKL